MIEADFLIAMYQAAYHRYIGKVKRGGVVIHDKQLVSTKEGSAFEHIAIPATEAAAKRLNLNVVANIVALGAAIEISKVVTKDAFISAIEENMPERFKELNLKAANIGFSLGQERNRCDSGGKVHQPIGDKKRQNNDRISPAP